MRLSAPIYGLKRQAKQLSRKENIPLHQALDQIAVGHGYRRWSHLAAARPTRTQSERVLDALADGDRLLLAARPGHGKTLLGLEIAAHAKQRAMNGLFFTLDYSEADVVDRLATLEGMTADAASEVTIDTSDEICGDYIIDRLSRINGRCVAVIDYLQLLDQRRSTPDLKAQVADLASHAQHSGDIIVAISQIDRSFEGSDKAMPDLADIRLPNPIEITRFNRACILHDGLIRLSDIN